MVKLYSPDYESELVLIKSLFEAELIHYYVLNDHFGTLRVGPKIDLFNAKVIYVAEAHYERAQEIISDFLAPSAAENEPFKSRYSLPDKIRMVFEAILFGWFVPGNRWKRRHEDNTSV